MGWCLGINPPALANHLAQLAHIRYATQRDRKPLHEAALLHRKEASRAS